VIATSRTRFDAPSPIRTQTETLGGSDVTHIFVLAMTSFDQAAYRRVMGPGVERYAERALLLARNHDVVCLAAPVEEAFRAWLHHLDVGVPADRIVVPRDPDFGGEALYGELMTRIERDG